MNKLAFYTKLEAFSKMPLVIILQKTFVSFSGILLVSSFLTLFQKGFENQLSEKYIGMLSQLSSIGFNFVSLFVIIAFTFYFFEEKQINHIPITLLNIALFVLMNTNGKSIDMTYMGARGVFCALMITYVSIKIYEYFINYHFYIRLPKEVPEVITESFMSIIPILVIVLFWGVAVFLCKVNLLSIIESLFSPLMKLGDSFLAVLVIPLLNRLLWFVGIHGAAVVNAIVSPVMTVMNSTNLTNFCQGKTLTYLASGYFYSTYVWIGVFPITLALITARNKKMKAVGIAGLIPTFFNIDEPILFGVPIILNPMLLIPHLLSGILPSVLSYIAIQFHWIPIPVLSIPWIIPAPFKAFLATNNDIRALLWILLMWLLMYLVYLPFLKKVNVKIAKM